MTVARFSPARVGAVVRKDIAEVARQPALFVPALLMVVGLTAPTFQITIIVPRVTGRGLDTTEFAAAAEAAGRLTQEWPGLSGSAGVQAYLLQQFLLFGLLVPMLGSLTLAAHSIIGEKQARALEPLLSTPITTVELLAAKTMMPLMVSAGLLLLTFGLSLAGMLLFGEPGVWRTLLGPRALILYLVTAPLLSFAALLLAAILSSRVNDPRSAQQLGAFLVMPITAVFVAQLVGRVLIGLEALLWGTAGVLVLDAILLWIGVRVFDRETILMRWK
jgi:ABC-2 type transport system permease protein